MLQLLVMGDTITITDFKLPGQVNLYHGKVRDVYTLENELLVSVATDRISAFDVILPRAIPFKGQVLNQIAQHFLKASEDIVPTWLLSVPDPNVSIGVQCQPFKIEMVIRGCLTGHAWREYRAGKRLLCGEAMPEGLQEYDTFPEPLITPSTKATAGHDEDISHAEIIKHGLASQVEFNDLCSITRKLFERGQEMAARQGLYLADTKYEFGKKDGKIYLIDEVHTPDSSRYFDTASYEAFIKDRAQPEPQHLSKEFVRQWLLDNNFSGQDGQTVPEMTDDFVKSVSDKYIGLFERITGQAFVPADTNGVLKRVESSIKEALRTL